MRAVGRILAFLALVTVMTVTQASARSGAPRTSLWPEPRPVGIGDFRPDRVLLVLSGPGVRRSPRPRPRPDSAPQTNPKLAPSVAVLDAPGLRRSPLPRPRPRTLHAKIAHNTYRTLNHAPNRTPVKKIVNRHQPAAIVTTTRQGAICGDRSIRGQRVAPVRGRLPGSGIASPVKVSSVSGVDLRPPAVISCGTAKALKRWVDTGAKPAVGRLGGGLASLRIAASYAVRTRNNQPGAKLSEHAKGNAVDISAITLKNGLSMDVRTGWNKPLQGKVLRRMHRTACGPFGTVLGPDADRFHRDHFHFDTARYRGGPYCR